MSTSEPSDLEILLYTMRYYEILLYRSISFGVQQQV